MASIVLGAVGGVVGGIVGGPIGAAIGQGLGSAVGSGIDASLLGSKANRHVTGPRLANLMVQSSSYGNTIAQIYGNARIAGNVIWSLPIQEHEQTTEHSAGGKGGGGGGTVTQTTYSYSATLAVAVCAGVIDEITRVWADSKILNLSLQKENYRIYYGTEDQLPDSLMEAHLGKGNVPAYRGVAYVVIENFPLADFGNRIPNFTFEVRRQLRDPKKATAEELVTCMNVIPGSGEFVYDTEIKHKQNASNGVAYGKKEPINANNHMFEADANFALKQMHSLCPNLKWVAPVSCWFTNSLNAGECQIKPAVESRDNQCEWNVGDFDRQNAHLVSRDSFGRPAYGGSVNDDSMLNYLARLRDMGYQIMFYPMIFVDSKTDKKPWRGRIVAETAADIDHFFDGKFGYRNFILQQAQLVHGHVDAFLIGSEFKQLTMFQSEKGKFPFVEKLIELAKDVRQILGENVKISYAADWSEYHHSDDGHFHLDELWADENIDFIGIDAYFPLTNSFDTTYDKEQIKKSWVSGECYDYYVDENGNEQPLKAEFAIKNLQHFWENEHHHQGDARRKTKWQPKSKKIWFTEYGFPSVDCASNQPNVFFDPSSSENAFPKHSKGMVDFAAQRAAIEATEEFWQNSEFVENKFLWTFDARPYPFWPRLKNVWSDGDLWQLGHWVNGKFGACSLASVLKDLCLKAGLKESQLDLSQINETIDGFFLNGHESARSAIEQLQRIFFFDIIELEGKIVFISRKKTEKLVCTINEQEICLTRNGRKNLKITKISQNELPRKIELSYFNFNSDFQISVASSSLEHLPMGAANDKISLSLPFIADAGKAQTIAEIALAEAHAKNCQVEMMLPAKFAHLHSGQLIEFENDKQKMLLRIRQMQIAPTGKIRLKAISEQQGLHEVQTKNISHSMEMAANAHAKNTEIHFLDLNFDEKNEQANIYIAASTNENGWGGALVLRSSDGGQTYEKCAHINKESITGKITSKIGISSSEIFDWKSEIIVALNNGQLEGRSKLAVLNGANLALIGQELVQFCNCKYLGNGQWKLTGLLRGKMGTNVMEHEIAEDFILIDQKLTKISLPKDQISTEDGEIKQNLQILTLSKEGYVTQEKKLQKAFHAKSMRPLKPIIKKVKIDQKGDLQINWLAKGRHDQW